MPVSIYSGLVAEICIVVCKCEKDLSTMKK